MPLSRSHPEYVKTGFFSFVGSTSPLWYGVTGTVAITVIYAIFHILPMLRSDLDLLRQVRTVDEKGMALESELQYNIQESRRKFLRVLLAAKNPAQRQQEIQSMRGFDAQVALTQSRIEELGPVAADSRKQFDESWQRYLTARDATLAVALRGDPETLRAADPDLDPDLGRSAFLSVQQAVQSSEAAFEASSISNLARVSTALKEVFREVILVIAVKVAVLLLLAWLDLRRTRVEKQLRRATQALRSSEERFRLAYDSASVGMGLIKLDGTVLSANRMAAQILGYEVGELVGMKVSDFMAPECKEDHLQRFANTPQTDEKSYRVERRVLRKDGTAAWVRNSVTLLQPEGQEGQYFSLSEEITAQKEANDRLAYLANFDPVTNLPNRHFFEARLAEMLISVAGTTDCIALLYLELDSFDFLKGTFGRIVADEILSELGASLSAFCGEGEMIARLDDHVFGILIKAAPYDEATLVRAGELRSIFHQASQSGKHRIPISASIGIAYSSDETGSKAGVAQGSTESELNALLKFGRAAMLEARSRGGDSIYLADPALQERAAQRHQIESALLHGLRENEFKVVFQPQFEIATGKLVRFEALCRWNSGELGAIPPDRFIPIAEQTGLISEIGRRVMNDALHQAKTWIGSGRRIGVAVNISPMQFMRPDFTNSITEVLAQSQFPPALLELEITEGIFIRDLNLAVARIRELQRLGLSIALDDFGTGYSSLSYLQRMPIDAVKLDRSFVSDLTTDAATVSMVRSVLAMANALKLRVVTEGVETEQQLEILRALGCDEAQGYLLGRPESAEMALRRVMESPMQAIGTLA